MCISFAVLDGHEPCKYFQSFGKSIVREHLDNLIQQIVMDLKKKTLSLMDNGTYSVPASNYDNILKFL